MKGSGRRCGQIGPTGDKCCCKRVSRDKAISKLARHASASAMSSIEARRAGSQARRLSIRAPT
eukprot:9836238-Alexandrium_andersonii.AAC.1